jgi:hypothetical protein
MNIPSRLPQFHIVGFTGHRQLAQTREIQGAVRTVLVAVRQEGPGEWIALSSAVAGAAPLFEELDLPGLRQLTRSLQVLHRRSMAAQSATMDQFKQLYLAHRIDDQHGYYGRRLAQALPLLRRLRAGFWVTTVLAIICTACYASAETWHFVEVPAATKEWVFHFLPIALPVVAAAFLSLVSINDLHRRVARYREMQTTLDAARKQIAYSQTWGSLERIVQRTERALLQEVFEWHSITSFAESH